jgi:deazaflavin-dependent oxidoreductase (nitroreductase family)
MADIGKIVAQANIDGWIADHRAVYVADGEAGHMWDSGTVGGPGLVPTLLLTTIGRKSGTERIMPLIYGPHADGVVVIASRGGTPEHPGWFHNLMAAGEATVQVATDVFQVRPRVVEGTERDQIWARMREIYAPYDAYQARTDRLIPVVVLERIDQA